MVWYLTKFINASRWGSYTVDIEAEIQKYKSKNPGRKPTIVFDFSAVVAIFIANNDEIFSGGRLDLSQNKIDVFLRNLKDLGTDLVFFDDGQIKEDKFPSWLQRVNSKYERQCKMFEQMRRGKQIDIPYKIQTSFCLYEVILRIAKQYGKFFVSLHNECDLDCAAYATKIRAAAVMTLDTDFVIMPGDWPIWLTNTIDLDRFTVTAWNKKAIRMALNLSQSQMPIFATLSGNNWIHKERLYHVYEMFRRFNMQLKLAEFIRMHFPSGVPLSKNEFEHLVSIIYNNGHNSCTREEALKMVSTSLRSYSYEYHHASKISPKWLMKQVEETSSNFIYTLVKDLPIVIHQSYIDLSRRDVRAYSQLALPIVRKQIGVSDYHKSRENNERIIYLKPSHEEPYQQQKTTPIFPDFEIPPLNVLQGYDVTEEDSDSLEDKRLEVFCWIISTERHRVETDDIKTKENKALIISALVLTYLVTEHQITSEEADVMLLSIHETINASQEQLENIEAPQVYQERAFWFAHVFLRLRQLYFDSFKLCGLYQYCEYDSYDGFVFHKMYKNYQSLDSDTKQPIRDYRIYAKSLI